MRIDSTDARNASHRARIDRAWRRWLAWSGLLAGLLGLSVRAADAAKSAGRLEWQTSSGRVSAQIDGWPLDRLLEAVAAKTRWRVFVDPQATHAVNAKFSDLPAGEALRRLLGSLNFALVPGTNAPARLYVFRTSQDAATLQIRVPARASSRLLADELIVTLKPGSSADVDELAAKLGAKIVGRADGLGAYRLKFESAEAAARARQELAGSDSVARVDANYLVDRPDTPEGALGSASLSPAMNLKVKPVGPGEGVTVAMIDTAIQGDAAGISAFLKPAISVAGDATLPADQLAHGTSMAATFLQELARQQGSAEGTSVRLLPVDVYGNNAATTSYEIGQGIWQAMNQGATIVNLSLGGEDDIPFIRELIRSGRQQGVVFLAAAGNEPVTTPTYPAAYPEVIAVTALNRRGEIAAYANYGIFVDGAGSGTSFVQFHGQTYVVIGTSPATASASALAAFQAASNGLQGAALEAEVRKQIAVDPAELGK